MQRKSIRAIPRKAACQKFIGRQRRKFAVSSGQILKDYIPVLMGRQSGDTPSGKEV